MKKLGLFAFGVTTCVLVPTVLHLLDAGPKQVAKLVAPAASTIQIGDAKIAISVDKSFVDAGDKVHVTLTATAEKKERVSVALLAYESTGTGGGRVETPPEKIGRDEVTLDIVNGTATKVIAFTLRGVRGNEMDGTAPFGHYAILAMPPADADKLEQLRRRASGVEPMMDSTGRYSRWSSAWFSIGREKDSEDEDAKEFGKVGQIARLDVNTRPYDSVVSILAPEASRAGQELAITVRVKNPSKKPVAKVTVSLSSEPSNVEGTFIGIDSDHVSIADASQDVSFAGKETKDIVFHVTPTTNGTLGLYARSVCDDCYEDSEAHGLTDSALDAVDIAPAERPVVVVQ